MFRPDNGDNLRFTVTKAFRIREEKFQCFATKWALNAFGRRRNRLHRQIYCAILWSRNVFCVNNSSAQNVGRPSINKLIVKLVLGSTPHTNVRARPTTFPFLADWNESSKGHTHAPHAVKRTLFRFESNEIRYTGKCFECFGKFSILFKYFSELNVDFVCAKFGHTWHDMA